MAVHISYVYKIDLRPQARQEKKKSQTHIFEYRQRENLDIHGRFVLQVEFLLKKGELKKKDICLI